MLDARLFFAHFLLPTVRGPSAKCVAELGESCGRQTAGKAGRERGVGEHNTQKWHVAIDVGGAVEGQGEQACTEGTQERERASWQTRFCRRASGYGARHCYSECFIPED